ALIELSHAVRYTVSSGLMLRDAMDLMSRQGTREVRPVAERIARDLKGGWSLQEALQRQEDRFPPLFTALAAVGEESGRLPEVMAELEKYYTTQQKLRRAFRSEISWPVFQFVAAVFVVAGLIFFLGAVAVPDSPDGKPVDPTGLGLIGERGALIFLLG